MKHFAVFLLLFSQAVLAIDPTIEPTKTLTCDMPVERSDGTPLAVDEIAEIRFFVSQDLATWTPAGTNTACNQVYNLTSMPDGVYHYAAQTVDTDGRESLYSDSVTLEVKRLAAPAAPIGLSF
jgi:hypothetical protein